MADENPQANLHLLSEDQNKAFDYEYHSEEEILCKIDWIKERFEQGPKRILDIGGGNGKFLDRFLLEFSESEGHLLDISKNLLEANAPHSRKFLVHGSVEDLKTLFPSERFDIITINWVLHHLVGDGYRQSVEHIKNTIKAAFNLLSDDGVIIIAENEYQGLLETNLPSHIIYAITRIKNPIFVRFAQRYFNTAGVGVCFQSRRGWQRIFQSLGTDIIFYQQHARWKHGLKKRLLFLLLLLRTQQHGHFCLTRPETTPV
jgi:Methylase involved in ubiquinone/menaquinone biosynthesis